MQMLVHVGTYYILYYYNVVEEEKKKFTLREILYYNDGIVFVNFFFVLRNPFSRVISKLTQKTNPFCIKKQLKLFFSGHPPKKKKLTLYTHGRVVPSGVVFFTPIHTHTHTHG